MESSSQSPRLAAELRNVSVIYGAHAAALHAVKNVSFGVLRGEVLLLMGPSGSGKSTILQVLGCIRSVTAGKVLIDEKPVHHLRQDELSCLRRERMGFVFQHYNLLQSLRAWENVALALELRGMTGSLIERDSRDTLERLGLEHRADAYPEQLSGGEKQRVAIARAVVGRPDIVLADEPTAALDAVSGSQVAQLLASIAHENGCAVIVVTHDARITGIADRLAYLDDGALLGIQNNIVRQEKPLRGNNTYETDDRPPGSLDGRTMCSVAAAG